MEAMHDRKRPDWQAKACVQENALSVPAAGLPWREETAALLAEPSPYQLDLCGEWQFACMTAALLPEDIETPDAADAGWGSIRVPGCWQLAGWDRAMRTGTECPEALHPNTSCLPALQPDEVPVGVYRRRFALPAAFAGRRTLLELDRTAGAAAVYCNGAFAGYASDSFNAHRFDLTELVRPGENLLVIFIYEYSAGRYLDCRPGWQLSGLCGAVSLVSLPLAGIEDIRYSTRSELENAPVLEATVTLSAGLPEGCSLRLCCAGPEGTAAEGSFAAVPGENRLRLTIPGGKLWSDEEPNLYRLAVSLQTADGLLDLRAVNVGLRCLQVEKRRGGEGACLLLNGRPVTLRGVEYAEFSPTDGWAVSTHQLNTDLRLLKQHNLNAIRTGRRAPSRALAELCDRYGILLFSEVSLQTAPAADKALSTDTGWNEHPVWRTECMVRPLAADPSVICWSLGGAGSLEGAYEQMKAAADRLDGTRPLLFEGRSGLRYSDLFAMEQVTLLQLQHVAMGDAVAVPGEGRVALPVFGLQYSGKPFLLTGYAAARGNSLGGLSEYFALFDKYPRLRLGGFVRGFAEQALLREGRWNTGGSDEPLCGIFSPDRKPRPAAAELKQLCAPFRLSVFAGSTVVKSLLCHHTPDTLALRWALLEDGRPLEEGELPLGPIAPGEERTLQIPYSGRPSLACVDLVCRLVDTAATHFAPAGRVICGGWARLQPPAALPAPTDYMQPVKKFGKKYILTAKDVKATVSGKTGQLVSLSVAGRELLSSPVTPVIGRPLIPNDLLGTSALRPKPERWLSAATGLKLQSVTADELGITVHWRAKGMQDLYARWQLGLDGSVAVRLTGTPTAEGCPRIGLLLGAAPELTRVEYFGLGPDENYPDRCAAALPGLWQTTADRFGHSYLTPQENGSRQQVWAIRLSGEGAGLCARAESAPFAAAVHTCTLGSLESSFFPEDLETCPPQLYLDGAVQGVGDGVNAGVLCGLKKGEKVTLAVRLIAGIAGSDQERLALPGLPRIAGH